ncbi:c-type cytochrome [Testudinibacter sp. TR-2022]|uniref:c-type cytochrome n=1 Tax=Testudinibacter sp. TR-2022 TaxID=2585029 RepID=UPI0011191D02|nr:c-type cytochrome [Testudinibacter sp. TR-2022]TNH04674.1 c-type cytochrome [Pasteurellaceae bacterium Phil31]TNH08417.1 c-type cytochrome [Pasteurellaceae bacterium Phil11]TNH10128.1 c-type cytochrome [Testudinibacter sp. TR-2022]TNH12523.1 c-type cytochrome [Testudinibacter sp. TR-2022]TNH15546.1 c-type cytochrome [Testudinibacter sp. TR-2022]
MKVTKVRFTFKHLCSFILALLTAQSAIADADIAKGKRQYQQLCAMCHGRNADKQALNSSAIIAGLPATEIASALHKRKNGEIDGGGNTVKARLTEQDMQNLAAYIETLGK